MDSLPNSATVASVLDRDGYVLLRGVLDDAAVARAAADCAAALTLANSSEDRAAAGSVLTGQRGAAYGARNLLRLWPEATKLLRAGRVAAVLADLLGSAAGVVRGLFFDKPPGATWSLPWHRDMTIAVKRHVGSEGFRKPTVKAGVPHVEAPADLLAAMLTARVHLDAVTMQNGPLQVVPGSHRLDAEPRPVETILCSAGDVLLMRPLLSHSSIQCAAGCVEHRRIVHLEMSPVQELPDGYEWHDWLPLDCGQEQFG
jgi:ectoine hydroxylase-related dioxygenase (phytanoyl-CoA dioxygenase family)